MALNLNMDLGDIFRGLKSNKGGNPYALHVIGGVFLLIGLLIFVFFVAIPAGGRHDEMQTKVETLDSVRTQVQALQKKLLKEQSLQEQSRKSHAAVLSRFNDDAGAGTFYGQIAQLAKRHGLTLTGLTLEKEEPVYSSDAKPTDPKIPTPEVAISKGAKPLFIKARFKMMLKGSYIAYLRFHGELAQLDKFASMESETITPIVEKSHGEVLIKANLITLKMVPVAGVQTGRNFFSDSKMLMARVPYAMTKGSFYRVANTLDFDPNAIVPPKNKTGVRDPFAPLSPTTATTGVTDKTTDLSTPQPGGESTFLTVGVMLGAQSKVAILQTDSGEKLLVKVGDRIGVDKLLVVDIHRRGVVVRTKNGNITLPMKMPVASPSVATPTAPSATGATP